MKVLETFAETLLNIISFGRLHDNFHLGWEAILLLIVLSPYAAGLLGFYGFGISTMSNSGQSGILDIWLLGMFCIIGLYGICGLLLIVSLVVGHLCGWVP